jgi:hypothetical protein
MIFATTCFGEDRRQDTLHFLNDIRNLNFKTHIITNLELNLDFFQYDNVTIIKVDTPYYQDFFRYQLILDIFNSTDDDLVYYLDSDSRFIDFREEKFDTDKFLNLIKNKNFDIITSWMTDNVALFFESPEIDENKNIRQFKYGYTSVCEFMDNNYPNYQEFFNLPNSWEGHLMFKKSDKVIKFLTEMVKVGNILIDEDIKNNRNHIACCSSSLITLMSKLLELNLIQDSITHHFFKANFLREVFPFNFKIYKDEKVFTNNN